MCDDEIEIELRERGIGGVVGVIVTMNFFFFLVPKEKEGDGGGV